MAEKFDTGLDYLNSVPAAAAMPLPALRTSGPPQMMAQPVSQAQGPGLIPSLVSQAEQAKGGRLSPEELMALGERAKVEHVVPGMLRKGVPQFQVESMAGAFDSYYARYMDDYLKAGQPPPVTPGTGTPNSFVNEYIKEPLTAIGAGLVDMVGGAATTLDLAKRGQKASAGLWKDILTGKRSISDIVGMDDSILQQYAPEKGVLAKVGEGISEAAEGMREWGYTEETRAAQAAISEAASNDDYKTLGKLLMQNPQATITQVGELVGGLGIAGKATKIPKYAELIKSLAGGNAAMRYGARAAQILPSAVGYAGQQAQQFERSINESSIDELTANPRIKVLYESLIELGLEPGEAEKSLKQKLINNGLDEVLTTSLIANLALPAVGGLGVAERAFAGGGSALAGRGAVRGALSGLGREGVEESIASGIEQAGMNVARLDPLSQGVGGSALVGGVTGALLGGGVGAAQGRRGNTLKRKTQTSEVQSTTEGTNEATTDEDVVATVPQQAGPTFSSTPIENFGTVTAQVTTAVQEDKQAKDAVKKADNPLALIETANRIAEAKATQVGTAWNTLSLDQQIELTEATTEILNKSRKAKAFEAADLVASLATWKTAVNPPAAPSPLTNPAATAAAPVAPTEAAQTPAATAVPATTPAPVAPADATPAEAQAAFAEAAAVPEQAGARAEALFLDGYLKTIAGIDTPNATTFRELDTFNEAQALYREGKITTPQELQAFLAAKAVAPTKTNKLKKTKAAPAVETVSQVSTEQKKKPLAKGKTQPPKSQAPAQEVTGAAEESLETAANVNQPNPNDPEQLQVRISGILNDSTIPDKDSVVDDLVLAVAEGNIAKVASITSRLQKDDDITAQQRRTINELVKIKPKPTLEVVPDEDIGSVKSLEERAQFTFPNITTNKLNTNITVRPKLKRWWKGFISGKMTQEQMMEEVVSLGKQLEERALDKQLKRAFSDRVRGVEWFEERLSRAARTGEIPTETIRLMRWLIRKNPNVVKEAGFSIKQLNKNNESGVGARGEYNPVERIITLASDAEVADTTGVHEILHHTERMMPLDVRDGIRKAYVRSVMEAYMGAKDLKVKEYLQMALEVSTVPGGHRNPGLVKELTKAYGEATKVPGVKSLYQYYSPSEYWAVNAPLLVQARETAERGTWLAKAIQWLKEFIETLKDILGSNSNRAIIKGFDSILKSDGTFTHKNLIAGEIQVANSLDLLNRENWANSIKQGEDNAKTFWEFFAQKTYALEQEQIRVIQAGGKVTPESDIVEAMVRYNGLKNDRMSLDESEVGSSVYNWVTENWHEYGNTREEAIKNLNVFFHNTHVLERTRVLWLQNVKLGGGREYDRAQLIAKVREGKIDPDTGRKQLQALVGQHALETEQAYAARRINDYDKMLSKLVELKKQGIDQKSMAEFNGILQNVRNRTLDRNIESGFVSEDDPWIKFYGFKWYVPLKGIKETEMPDEVSDLDQEGRNGRAALARINKQLETMSGRKSIADSPLEQLLMDMSLAGRRSAEQNFVGSLYALIQGNRKLYSDAVINVFEGRPKDGYKQVSGKFKRVKGKKDNKTFFRVLPAPGDGFIYHDGDTHYQVILPRSSKLLRGVLAMGSDIEPDFFSKVVGKGTNLLSKLYTTANPLWQTFVALPRDLTYMPTMLGIRHASGPVEGTMLMGRYISTLLSNTFQLSNFPAAWAILSGDRTKLIEYAKEHPDSAVAWLRRYESAGGSTNFVAGFNRETIGNKLMDASENDEGIWVVKTPWRKWEQYTSNYASLLENIGRTAAFRTLKEANPKMTDAEAAAKVKDFLNYDQTGRASRYVNSYIPFFKVGMTGADAIRRSFRKPDGSYDLKKFGQWSLYFMVLGMAKYFLDDELLGEDEHGERKIKKIKLDTMTQKMIMPGGNKLYGFNYGLGLPQILATPGVIVGALMKGHVTEEEAGRAYYDMIARNAPVRPAGLPDDWGISNFIYAWTIGGLVPGVVRPVTDIRANEDAFGRPVHTAFPADDKFKSEQAKSSTPQEWTEIATTLRESMGIDIYPEDIRYLVRNYGGQPASVMMRLTVDSDAKLDEGAESMRSVGRATGVEVTDQDFYMRNEVYATLSKLSESKKRLDAFKKKAAREGTSEAVALRQALAADPGINRSVAAYKALDKANTAYNKKLKEIRADKMRGQTWKDLERKKADSQLRAAVEAAKRNASLE